MHIGKGEDVLGVCLPKKKILPGNLTIFFNLDHTDQQNNLLKCKYLTPLDLEEAIVVNV